MSNHRILSIASVNTRFVLLITLFILSIAGCSNEKQTPHQATIVVFGTLVDITVYHEDAKQANLAIQQVEQDFHRFHTQWHAWERGGIVSKINAAIASETPITVADSVKQFILTSQQLTRQSQGLFDPGIGQLIALWGFHSEAWQGPPPSDQAIQAWLAHRPSLLDLYFEGHTLRSKNRYVQLDFGGNAKGLAINMALSSLEKAGIHNAIVSIGGDMKAMGLKNNQTWSVGIQSPQSPSKILASLHLNSGESIVTSGTYQRYFEWQGQRYAHVLNPNTGYPAHSFSSVTVLHPDAITADAAATALLIAGPNDWLNIAQKMGVDHVLCLTETGDILQTPKMASRLKMR
ncbi:MAG: FAD:protein FMN transferase [Gammaproteobacteria bacterium]|nr:FAD:protein FMN transferase [Gammaproteobacteria bacterium]